MEKSQYELLQEIVKKAGINIVTCANCPTVILHELENEEIKCPDCQYVGETCDFPDLHHENNNVAKTKNKSYIEQQLDTEAYRGSVMQSALEKIACGSDGEDPAEIADSVLGALAVT